VVPASWLHPIYTPPKQLNAFLLVEVANSETLSLVSLTHTREGTRKPIIVSVFRWEWDAFGTCVAVAVAPFSSVEAYMHHGTRYF
jgi:hypothetical protein